MNVVYLRVLAAPDVGIVVLMLLSALGAAMLMLLTSAAAARNWRSSRAAGLIPLLPATPMRTRLAEGLYPAREMARAFGVTRAPPRGSNRGMPQLEAPTCFPPDVEPQASETRLAVRRRR